MLVEGCYSHTLLCSGVLELKPRPLTCRDDTQPISTLCHWSCLRFEPMESELSDQTKLLGS